MFIPFLSDKGNILYNLLVGLLDRSVVPVSFLVRNVCFHFHGVCLRVSGYNQRSNLQLR